MQPHSASTGELRVWLEYMLDERWDTYIQAYLAHKKATLLETLSKAPSDEHDQWNKGKINVLNELLDLKQEVRQALINSNAVDTR